MSAPTQLPLPLTCRPALGREDFFEAPANAVALKKIDGWTRWPGGRLLLLAPNGAGKSHLAAVWAAQADARLVDAAAWDGDAKPVAVEDIDRVAGDLKAEERLFHGYNRMVSAGVPLLLTAEKTPLEAGFQLPDLLSRLQSVDTVKIEPPDDMLLSAVLAKHFTDRQFPLDHEAIAEIMKRTERSFEAAARIVDQIDRTAFATKRGVTLTLVKDVLLQNRQSEMS